MRSRLVVILTAATLLTGVQAARADSQPISGGQVSVPAVIPADDVCVNIPVTYDTSALDATWHWELNLDMPPGMGPFTVGDGGDTGIANGQWCPDDLPGTFHLTGSLTVFDANYQQMSIEPVALQVAVRKQVTTAAFAVSDTTPRAGHIIHLKGCVNAEGHRDAYREYAIQYRKPGGQWRQLSADSTSATGCFSEDGYSKKAGRTYLRVKVPATGSRMGTYSRTITIQAHP